MKNSTAVLILIGILLMFFVVFKLSHQKKIQAQQKIAPLWEYECIDTMKTSRDKARLWASSPSLDEHINNQMDAIVEAGGNCVAIGTPYDEEFLPYLRRWVSAARERNLHVWFRGNFSSWEGWFDYPKGMTTAEHNQLTKEFVTNNRDLFEDGDVFTPAPEAENGGPFNQVERDEHVIFRKYLIEEYTTAKNAFSEIHKNVRVNWLAMNGGLALRMFDKPTVNALGGVVAIDHYIKTPEEMGEFIRYFNEKFGAKVVIGEWGAPIPDINGSMTEDQQAAFIKDLLWEMYVNKEMVEGISYWVLYDGSTSLQNPDMSPRKAFDEIRNYYSPGAINGYVRDSYGSILADAELTINGTKKYKADENGYFEFSIPAGDYKISVSHADNKTTEINLNIEPDKIVTKEIVLNSNESRIKHWYNEIILKLKKFLG